MELLNRLFGKMPSVGLSSSASIRADCSVTILEPQKIPGMVSAYVIVRVLEKGISIAYDRERSAGLDGFSRPLVIGAYHWANTQDNSLAPFVINYGDIHGVFFWIHDEENNKETEIEEAVSDTIHLTSNVVAFVVYSIPAKGKKVQIGLRVVDREGNQNSRATRELYNAIHRRYRSAVKR